MFFNAPTACLFLASPAFAAVVPLVARDVLEARQGGGGPFSGEATTFGGSDKSSCGAPLAAGAIAVALNGDWQTGISPNLAACGKQISITNGGNGLQGSVINAASSGKTITATVLDTCPECDRTHIDLTLGAWNLLTENSPGGVVGITWSFVGGAPSGGSSASDLKVAAKKVGPSKSIVNVADLPQGGDLNAGLQQTGSGPNNDTSTGPAPGSGSSTPGSGSSTPGSGSSTPGSGSSTPGSGSSTPGSGSTTPGSGSTTPVSGSTTPGSGSDSPGSGSSSGQGAIFTQCGGQDWKGATSCVSGTTCQVQNQYYSQCLP